MSILIWVEQTVLIGIPSTYRKAISEDESMFDSVMYSIKRTFLSYCLIVLVFFSIISPFISQFFNDSKLLLLLLIAGIDIPLYGMYYGYLSILNGRRKFAMESISMSIYAFSKVLFAVLFVLLGLKLQGALIGNAFASLFGLLVTFYFVKKLKPYSNKKNIIDLKSRMITFGFPYLLYGLATMFLINIDMWSIKGVLTDDIAIGYYSVSTNLSKPLLLLVTAIIAVMFPAFSRALSEGDIGLLQKYMKQAIRMALVILCPMVVMLTSTSNELITLLFTAKYLPASISLKILSIGISLFSIFSIFLNFIAATNKPFYCFMMSLSLVPIAIVLNYFLIISYGIEGAALATTGVSGIGVIMTGIYLWKKFGAIVNFLTVFKILVAVACLYFISTYIPASDYYLFPKYIFLSLVYLGLLLLLKEINAGDIGIIRETLLRKNSAL